MKPKNGGVREGAGRPRIDKENQKRRNICLSDKYADKAKELGGGNISAGIRKALEGA